MGILNAACWAARFIGDDNGANYMGIVKIGKCTQPPGDSRIGQLADYCHGLGLKVRSRRLFVTTKMLENAIARQRIEPLGVAKPESIFARTLDDCLAERVLAEFLCRCN